MHLKFLLVFWSLLGLIGCQQSHPEGTYGIYVMRSGDAREYIVRTDQLDSGRIDPISKGVPVPIPQFWAELIERDGNFYHMNRKSGYLVRHRLIDQHFTAQDSVALPDVSFIENYSWPKPDSLFLISYNRKISKLQYARVDVRTMQAQTGKLPLPLPFGPYNSMSVGFSHFRGSELFVGYTYHTVSGRPGQYTTSDTLYVTTLAYPSMRLIRTQKDTKSTYPGSVNTEQPSTFADEKGDFYFLACPGFALGNHPQKPTAIYRIKAGEATLDSTYFFNISVSAIHNHAYGLWYIGKGQAIVRSERRELFKTMEDHYQVPHLEFYVVDLNQKTTRKLALPLDKGSARSCVLVDRGLVYISVNAGPDNNYIWVYNPNDQSLRKGLKIEGSVDYLLRLEKLKEASGQTSD
ncbi:hypothetical protein C5O19_10400 [Siphonobacter curvatus]|uniref:DUF4374 domain-containing protein n=2 Tax=Siphonobacter curvatus TaxID=2094562 RepID=A0A2S7IQL9_9BACT|nr:hypothetical protein C5O19_10400 [Siphonobacter curvatus]